MDRLQAVSIKLTTEEILVLLDQLKINSYPGLDTSQIDELSDRERNLVLDVARRGLIARQMLSQDDSGEWQVSQFVTASLGVSIAPQKSVLITSGRSREEAESYLFHTAQDVYTTLDIVDDGTHHFLVMVDRDSWQQAILSAAGLSDSADERTAGPALTMSSSDLNQAHENAQSGLMEEAKAILTAAGVAPDAVGNVAAALGNGILFSTVTAVTHGQDEDSRIFNFAASGRYCWELTSNGGQAGSRQISMMPISVGKAKDQISAIIT